MQFFHAGNAESGGLYFLQDLPGNIPFYGILF